MKTKESVLLKYPILNEFDLSFLSSKEDTVQIFFYNNRLLYFQKPNVHLYNVELKKDDYEFEGEYFIFNQINQEKLCIVTLNSILVFNSKEKEFEAIIPARFYLLFDVICLEEKVLVILGRDYIHIVDIKTQKIVQIKYPNWEMLEAYTRRVLPLNDEIVIVLLKARVRGPFFCLVNWKTKQLVTSIHVSTIHINRISGKIEKGLIKNKPISKLLSEELPESNIGEIFTLDRKFYHYMRKNNSTFYFSIVKNRIIGYLKHINDTKIAIRVIDIKNYTILQQFDFKSEFYVDDFFSNSDYFIFLFGNEYVGFKINKENVEKYLKEEQ